MNAEADKESILPYIKMFQQLIRYDGTIAIFIIVHLLRLT